MKKSLSVKEDWLFRRIYAKGKSFASPSVVVYARKNGQTTNRIGLTSSKKIGCAVKRNRARRVMREAYRLLSCEVKTGYDFIFVARSSTADCNMNEVMKDMRTCFEKLGLSVNVT